MKSLNQSITKLSDNHCFIFFNTRFGRYSINPFDKCLNFSFFMYSGFSFFELLFTWIRKWLNLHFDKWQHIALIGSYCPIQTSVWYCIKSVTLHPNGKGTADGAIRSLKSIFPIRQAEDYCVLKDTARYVLGCSKYFEQLKTPCPYRKLDFLRSRKSFQISDAIFTLLNGLNYSLSTLLLILWVCIFASDDWAVQDTLVQLHHLPTQEENNFSGMMYDVWIPYWT